MLFIYLYNRPPERENRDDIIVVLSIFIYTLNGFFTDRDDIIAVSWTLPNDKNAGLSHSLATLRRPHSLFIGILPNLILTDYL